MAHDFEIKVKNAPYEDGYYAYFFGFAQGVMYEAFEMWEHFQYVSGDNEDIVINRKRALKGISTAIKIFDTLDYPDKTRMDEIKEFYKKMQNEFKHVKEYVICFS